KRQTVCLDKVKEKADHCKQKPAVELKMQIELDRHIVQSGTPHSQRHQGSHRPQTDGGDNQEDQRRPEKFRGDSIFASQPAPESYDKDIAAEDMQGGKRDRHGPVSLDRKTDQHTDHGQLCNPKQPVVKPVGTAKSMEEQGE